ncbi:MAG TPA: PTS sugar transporter subunit IIA [Alphaproteobacteria bacterium]
MNVRDLIKPEHVIARLRAPTKDSVLQLLAKHAASALAMDAPALADLLVAREMLGSTGLGRGIAVPHTLVKGLPGFFGVLARLERPIDFAAIDALPVDVIVLLLSPANAGKTHLAALAAITRRLRDTRVADGLRAAPDPQHLYEVFVGSTQPTAARAS